MSAFTRLCSFGSVSKFLSTLVKQLRSETKCLSISLPVFEISVCIVLCCNAIFNSTIHVSHLSITVSNNTHQLISTNLSSKKQLNKNKNKTQDPLNSPLLPSPFLTGTPIHLCQSVPSPLVLYFVAVLTESRYLAATFYSRNIIYKILTFGHKS